MSDPGLDDVPAKSARKVRLASLLRYGLLQFSSLCDFGANWERLIEVKREDPVLPGEEVRMLLAGQRRCRADDIDLERINRRPPSSHNAAHAP